jgi:hypothetical protein
MTNDPLATWANTFTVRLGLLKTSMMPSLVSHVPQKAIAEAIWHFATCIAYTIDA